MNTYQSLSGVLTHIQLLWELILLNEPIAILGNYPTNCSQTVQALGKNLSFYSITVILLRNLGYFLIKKKDSCVVSFVRKITMKKFVIIPLLSSHAMMFLLKNLFLYLVHIIWPLRYASDYRPYFTIQNSEFYQITKTTSSVPSMIIGVTNPLFSKLIHRWPHIIRLNDNSHDYSSMKKTENFLLVEHDQDSLSVNELEDSMELSMSPPKPVISNKVSTRAKPLKLTESSNTTNNSSITLDIKIGLYTKYRPYLQRDTTILKRIQSTKAQQRPDTVQNVLLRRFFLELTQSFIIPLERYFCSLLPLRKYYHPNRDPPVLKQFNEDDFFKTLDQYGPQLTSGLKGDWKDLYKHFLSTANFRLWLSNRQQEANDKIFCIHIETIANCRLEEDFRISRITEVAIMELVKKFRDIIQCLELTNDRRIHSLDVKTRHTYVEKLQIKMQFMIDQYLSNDMKSLFY